jgi:predicted RNA-binding Zn ribbon-like protein
MNTAEKRLETIEIVGGHPAVDFVNTVHSWRSDPPPDYLHGFDDFIDWNRMFELIGPESAARFKAAPAKEKARAFREALELRHDLHELLGAVADEKPLPQPALDHLNDVVRRTAAWRRLAADEETGGTTISCVWNLSEAPVAAALGPVAWQAVNLLEHGRLERLKECPGESCGWLFIDSSKNRSRTWCSMKTCGNTAKVKRFRKRAGD